MEIKSGLILSKKSTINICKRKKKEIVLPELSGHHIGKPIYICGKQVYGVIILNAPHNIDDQQFDSHFNRHFVSKGFREKVWPDVKKFYSYSFRIKKIYKKPLDYICDDKWTIRFLDDVELVKTVDLAAERDAKLKKRLEKYMAEANELNKLEFSDKYEKLGKNLLALYNLYLLKSHRIK